MPRPTTPPTPPTTTMSMPSTATTPTTTKAKPTTTRRSRAKQPRVQNRLDTKEFREAMRAVTCRHISNIERKHPTVPTTLPLEELLLGGKKKRGCRGVSRPQNAFVLYRKDV